jgi:hypothetical protein
MSCCLMSALVLPNLLLLSRRSAVAAKETEEEGPTEEHTRAIAVRDADDGGPGRLDGPEVIPVYRRLDAAA